MNFHKFTSSFDNFRKDMPEGPTEFYRGMVGSTIDLFRGGGGEGFAIEHNRMVAEERWYKNGNPYYKLFPAVIPMLGDVGISIPSKFLKLPFNGFVVQFPTEDNPFQLECGRCVKAMLVHEGETIIDGDTVRDDRSLSLWIDTGEIDPTGATILNYLHMILHPEVKIDDDFKVLPRRTIDMTALQADQLLRIAVSVCFLATGSDRLISPDVLSKDLAAWIDALRRNDAPRREVIEARAVRRGKQGWNVGAGERMLVRSKSRDGNGHHASGYELSYQHQRTAHFRTLPSSEVVFIRQLTVRADLPPKQAT